MQVHRRTEITVETSEILVVRQAQVYRGWCAECGQEVDMVGLGDAHALAEKSGRGMRREQSSGWHLGATGDTRLVCMPSLLKSL